jgi:hypothetical protein
MEGARSRSFLFFILILILMLNIISISVIAPEGELEIVVDSTSKEVSPGEEAVFYWTAYNNDTFTSYDLSVSSAPKTEFSETFFSLDPGESHTVTQTIETSAGDENNTFYGCSVTWSGVWHQGSMSGSITSMQWALSVYVVNNSNLNGNINDGEKDKENGEDDDNKDDSTPGFESIFLIAAILVAFLIVRKKRRK